MVDFVRKTKSAGGVVVNSDGKVLVVDQRGTSWSLPKGHIDDGETPLQTAKREIYEESGISDLEFVEELGSYQRHKIPNNGKGEDKSELKTIYMFLFTTTQNKLKPLDSHNHQAKWLKKEEVSDQLTHIKDKEFFQSIIEKI